MTDNNLKTEFMDEAFQTAKTSIGEVPVGAVLVKGGKIIAKSANLKETENNPCLHAEIAAITEACKVLNTWRLDDTSIYITLEPCPMCAAAILYARIPYVYFGAYDSLYGAFGSALNMQDYINFYPQIKGGIMEKECSELLKEYFQARR